jgi:CheY-like chemotaxis protein
MRHAPGQRGKPTIVTIRTKTRGSGAQRPVLVVEDDAETREALVSLLRNAGFTVVASDEGRKALELAEALLPSVVVLDLTMAGMDGREFLARRRDLPAVGAIPVLVVTGGRARDVSAEAVLTKPFDVGELVSTVRRLAGH